MAKEKKTKEKKEDKPKQQNFLGIARDRAGMTRREVAERCPWIMSESKLSKLEGGSQRITSEDVDILAQIYADEGLCDTYCHKMCAIGVRRAADQAESRPIYHIVIEMLSALNAANRRKDQIIDILADGKISSEEFADFEEIKKELMRIADVADELQRWTEHVLDVNLIPKVFDEK